MTLLSALGIVLRASFLLAISLAVLPAVRGSSASLRRWLLLLGLGAALACPLLALGFPGRPVMHVRAPSFAGHVVAEALSTDVTAVRSPVAARASSPSAAWRPSPSTCLWFVWASGALIVLSRVLRGALWTWRLREAAQPPRAAVRHSPGIEAPVVVGVFRPVVLLPVESQSWPEERLHAVLLHEFSHVRRYDGLALLIAQLSCALYWFQPLAWYARNRLRRECEFAADETVIAAGLRPSSYAQHLLDVARGLTPAGGMAMAARPSELARRIQVLVARERLPRSFTNARAMLLAAAALVVFACVACMDAGAKAAQVPVTSSGRSAPADDAGIDPRLQAIAEDEARRVHAEWGAERVAILVLDPHTGTLLASSDDAPGKPIVPASTLKPILVASALDAGLITTEQRFDCGNGTRRYDSQLLRDAGQYGALDAAEILAVSSNIGASRIFDLLGGARLGAGLQRFGIGAPSEIPSGMHGAIIALGEGSTTTPLALASAYGVFANEGRLALPGGAPPQRVIDPATAHTLRGMLEGVVSGERSTGRAAAVAGVRVGGKTGTSDPECCVEGSGTFAHFVGIVPIDAPRWVIYVGVGEPNRKGTGATISAPVFSRLATRALAL
jgi:beta-lactamase regulating signal transducer with metallopeptidase domain